MSAIIVFLAALAAVFVVIIILIHQDDNSTAGQILSIRRKLTLHPLGEVANKFSLVPRYGEINKLAGLFLEGNIKLSEEEQSDLLKKLEDIYREFDQLYSDEAKKLKDKVYN